MEPAILYRSRQLDDNGKGDDAGRIYSPARSCDKGGNQLLETEEERERRARIYPESRGNSGYHPIGGITAFRNYLKRKQKEQDDIKELTDGMSRLRIKNKLKKKKIVKLQQKLEASQRKKAILRAYNVELEARRKL